MQPAPKTQCDPTLVKVLASQYKSLINDPYPNLLAVFDPADIRVWYFLIGGLDAPFLEGEYIFRLTAPDTFPHAPPRFEMLTQNGVYQPGGPICISVGEFHANDAPGKDGASGWRPALGMKGFAIQVVNGLICYKDLTPGIRIQNLSDHLKAVYAKTSRGFNRDHYAETMSAFEALIEASPTVEPVRNLLAARRRLAVLQEAKAAPPAVSNTRATAPARAALAAPAAPAAAPAARITRIIAPAAAAPVAAPAAAPPAARAVAPAARAIAPAARAIAPAARAIAPAARAIAPAAAPAAALTARVIVPAAAPAAALTARVIAPASAPAAAPAVAPAARAVVPAVVQQVVAPVRIVIPSSEMPSAALRVDGDDGVDIGAGGAQQTVEEDRAAIDDLLNSLMDDDDAPVLTRTDAPAPAITAAPTPIMLAPKLVAIEAAPETAAPDAAAPETAAPDEAAPGAIASDAAPETVASDTAPETVASDAAPETVALGAAPETAAPEAAPETVVPEAAPPSLRAPDADMDDLLRSLLCGE